MSGGVDDVELVVVPEAGGGRRLNGDAALLLLIHEVCGCRTIMNFTDLVDFAGELQNSFGGGRFARIYVGKDTDIPVAGQVFHGDSLVSNLETVGTPRFRWCLQNKRCLPVN